MKKKHSKDRKKILSFFSDIEWFFNLNHTDRSITFMKEDTTPHTVLASVTWEEDYQRCNVNVYPAFFTKERKEQAETLIHELTHKLIEPIVVMARKPINNEFTNSEMVKHEMERVVSTLSQRFVLFAEGNGEYMKKAFEEYIK